MRLSPRWGFPVNYSSAPTIFDSSDMLGVDRLDERREFKDHPTFAHEKRWVKKPGYCLLCEEEYSSWGNHVIPTRTGIHRILEMCYDVVAQQEERRWRNGDILKNLFNLRANSSNGLTPQIHTFFLNDDRRYKHKLIDALQVLTSRGVFKNTFRTGKDAGNLVLVKGSNLLPIYIMKILLVIFSQFDSGYLSGILENILEWQNVERTYAALNCKKLFAQTEKHIDLRDGDAFKAMIGELHYATEFRPGRRKLANETRSLAQFALLGCLSEVLLTKMASWMKQVDHAWRINFNGSAKNNLLSKKHEINARADLEVLDFTSQSKQLTQFLAHRYHTTWTAQYEKRIVPGTRRRVAETEFGHAFGGGNIIVHSPNLIRVRFPLFFHVD